MKSMFRMNRDADLMPGWGTGLCRMQRADDGPDLHRLQSWRTLTTSVPRGVGSARLSAIFEALRINDRIRPNQNKSLHVALPAPVTATPVAYVCDALHA